jgi:hypothetical protein
VTLRSAGHRWVTQKHDLGIVCDPVHIWMTGWNGRNMQGIDLDHQAANLCANSELYYPLTLILPVRTIVIVSDFSLPTPLVVGPPGHGVRQYAADIADELGPVVAVDRVDGLDEFAAIEDAARKSTLLHLHVTDAIFGSSPDDAAARIERIAARTPLTVTLHDLPQPSDGTVNLARRSTAYRRIAAASRGVAVSSAHEAALFAEFVGDVSVTAHVIPLGMHRRAEIEGDETVPRPDLAAMTIALAGYVYPGKGHEEAIRGAARFVSDCAESGADAPAVSVVALGAVATGHASERDRLDGIAAEHGINFEVTGFLEQQDYLRKCRAAAIPLAAHTHISASRTIMNWGEVGRRPLVADSRYAREMLQLRPGSLTLYEPDNLSDALADAWHDPASTYLPTDWSTTWTLADAAKEYSRWWREDVKW